MSRTRILIGMVPVVLAGIVSSAFAGNIGLNFVGGRSGSGGSGTGGADGEAMLASDNAGVVPQMNWNNGFGANNAGPVALVDDSGAATGATASWGGVPNGWSITTSTAVDANGRLMNGYLDTNTSSLTVVNITGIPYPNYNVILYYDGDGTGRQGDYTANGITLRGQDAANWPVAAGGGSFNDATNDTIGNYLLFPGLTGDLTATATTAGIDFRAPLNGLQIIATPEPATTTLAAMGLAGLTLLRRRRVRM